jgi:hypothetical protein
MLKIYLIDEATNTVSVAVSRKFQVYIVHSGSLRSPTGENEIFMFNDQTGFRNTVQHYRNVFKMGFKTFTVYNHVIQIMNNKIKLCLEFVIKDSYQHLSAYCKT